MTIGNKLAELLTSLSSGRRAELNRISREEHYMSTDNFTDHARLADAIDPRKLVANYKRTEVAAISVDVDAAIAASDALRSRSWRPIESAPKEGTQVDVWRQFYIKGTPVRGSRVAAAWENGRWNDEDENGIAWGPDQYEQECRVTHWQPIIGPEVTK